MVIICFSIFSGIDCSEFFRISHLHDSVTCLYISIIHYLGLFIYVHMLVSRLKSDCDCYFSCTFYTFTTQYILVIESIFFQKVLHKCYMYICCIFVS